MLLPDDLIRAAVRRAGPARPLPGRTWLCPQRHAGGVALLLLVFAGATVAQGAGGKVLLTRKYRPGQSIVYVTTVRTNSKIDSNPPALKNFFPPMPADLRLSQQSTVTVSKVAPDGAADVQHRFDKFEIQTDLGALPENVRDSITQAQQEVSERMVGQTLTAHYDHDGRLVDFEGADKLFQDIDAPVREPLLQMLRLFLEQMGGQSLYPDHRVKAGEEWSQKLDAQPHKDYPFQVQGKSTLHYSGKMRYQGVRLPSWIITSKMSSLPPRRACARGERFRNSKPWGCGWRCTSAERGKAGFWWRWMTAACSRIIPPCTRPSAPS